MPTRTVEELRQRSKRYAKLAFVLGVLGFMLVLAMQLLFGAPVSWTSWALPLLLSANAGVMLLPHAHEHPRATAIYHRLSLVATLIILVGIVMQIFRQGAVK